MRNARLYILQVLGILVLLCGYLLRDQPDRLSVMHFDLSASNVTVVGVRPTALPLILTAALGGMDVMETS